MTQPVTSALGAFASGVRFDAIPPAAVGTVKQGFIDCIGVMLAGAREPSTAAIEKVLMSDAGPGRSTLYFSGRQAAAPVAAWINGTSAHALDYDDVALKGCHPSAVLVPAILAEAQSLGASGREMIAAYAAGYEVWAELIGREPGNYQRKGWHPTGIFGALGAAAACARLHGLDAERAAHALGIAVSHSSGVMSNLGSMVKPMHPGKAAACGILSARLAREGVFAAADAVEHAQGFLSAVSPSGEPDVSSPVGVPPSRWRILEHGLSIKKYPVCYRAHRAIDAIFDLARMQPFSPDKVREIRVTFSRSHAVILKNHRPVSAIEGKFSIEFSLACALIAGRVGLRDLTDEFVRRPDVQAMIGRVFIDINPEEETGTSGYSPFDWVEVELADGRRLKSPEVRHARGDASMPLDDDGLWGKFEDCIAWSGMPLPARGLYDSLRNLEHCESALELGGASGKPVAVPECVR
ncbi:MAG: MmgE/PrpD family protein [Burkholderiales bacterium]|nr:MmgE/PrpD family protein [Burkholderiales bacterium]MCW5603476.1 MmgE/PrpD family protein [Burkholderiales bacterium]